MAGKTIPLHQTYQFKVSLLGIEPIIWRRILVPQRYSFWDLHVALQDAMGWLDYHLHEFRLKHHEAKIVIGIPDDDGFEDDHVVNAGWELMISEYFNRKGDSAEYIYDFGDNWRHQLVLEDIVPKQIDTHYPLCTDGERACPPEDCGGIHGYERLLEIITDPKHEEHDDMKMWLKGHAKNYWPFRPYDFDPAEIEFDNPRERWDKAFASPY